MQKERAQASLGMRNVKAILQLRQSQQAEKMKEEKRKLVETLQVWFNIYLMGWIIFLFMNF